jgi:hypothetical protein
LSLILLSLIVSSLHLAGCARRPPAPVMAPIPANAFQTGWRADLDLKRDSADRLFLRDGLVFLYTKNNRVNVISAAGGELLASNQVVSPRQELRPPVLLGDKIVYPTLLAFEVYDRRGREIETVPLERATRSPATPDENIVYVGLDYGTGGRLAKFDITRPYGRTLWELMTFGSISAAPAVYENIIYAASEDGRVYAVDENRAPVWPMEGNTFLTAGPVTADVKVDDYAVYIASTDSKLYALDRATGRIRWQYFGGRPLRTPPVVTQDRVYQYVPGRGLVSISKTEGESFRKPLWTARAARRFLSADDKHVYVLTADGAIAALDKATGEQVFRSKRDDFTVSTANTRDSTIYLSTDDGEVLAVKPVLRAGTVGEIVLNDALPDRSLANAR